MTEDQINKVETLIGFLELLWNEAGSLTKNKHRHYIEGTIEEANEWIAEEKSLVTA